MGSRINKIQIRLTNIEVKMVEALQGRMGDISKSDAVRRCIQERFKKEFPAYITKEYGGIKITQKEEELTPEQICEGVGGKVIKREDGGKMCELKYHSGAVRRFPITMTDEIQECAEQIIEMGK